MEKMKNFFYLDEKKLGYLMVAPAILLISIVVIWPILRSFYNSMFDYRLNDPNRSQLMMESTVDLERYVDNIFYLENEFEKISEIEENSSKVNNHIENIRMYHEKFVNSGNTNEKVKQVQEKIDSFTPVRDNNLKYVKIEDDLAREYQKELDELSTYVESLIEKELIEADKFGNSIGIIDAQSETILESNFIGFKNYSRYLRDSRMWAALSNTAFFTIISVSLELIFGLIIALLVNRSFKGRGIVRASVLIPWAIPTAVSAMMWKFLLDGQNGIISYIFSSLNFIPNMSWALSTSSGGMFSVILADVWKTTPYMALLILAGLQTIDKSLYEASSVDGASSWQQFWSITLPMLKGPILVALLFRTLDAFRVFDLIYVLTGGGPSNATESISVYAYKTLFAQQNFGAGSVLSIFVFIFVAIISIVYIKFIGSELFKDKT